MTTSKNDPGFALLGHAVQHDDSGAGNNWRLIDWEDATASDALEIECEIIDGGVEDTELFVTSSGARYRW